MKGRGLLIFAFTAACYGSQQSACETGGGPTPIPPTPTPTATPKDRPSPSPSPTVDPCSYPVTGLRLVGPILPNIGEVFKIDVTPVSQVGLLEGDLDRCNRNRTPIVESMSVGLRCVGQCSGFGPQFVSNTLGAFTIRIRLEGISEVFAGTIVNGLSPTPKSTATPTPTPAPSPLLNPCKKFLCPTPSPSPRP